MGDLKYLYNITESNIIIKTCILSKYHFPVFFDEEGKQEKFCPEDVLYNKLVNEGKFRVVNDSVYISEYQQEGLTNSIFMLWKDNSNGVLDALKSRYSLFTEYNFIPRWVNRIKCVMNINALCMEKKKNIWLTSPSKPLSIILYMPSIFFRKLRFR